MPRAFSVRRKMGRKQIRFRTVYILRKVQAELGRPPRGKPCHAEWLGKIDCGHAKWESFAWFLYTSQLIPDRDLRSCILYARKRKRPWNARKENGVTGQNRRGHKPAGNDK